MRWTSTKTDNELSTGQSTGVLHWNVCGTTNNIRVQQDSQEVYCHEKNIKAKYIQYVEVPAA